MTPPRPSAPKDAMDDAPTANVAGTAEALAQASADAMWSTDRASQALGMRILEVRPGTARLCMTVRPDMTNGHGMCHGGYMFLLADSAFAFACNSRNQKTVAASAEIHFVSSAREGDLLTAEAQEQHLGGRSGIYDVRVTDQTNRTVALFRGKSAAIAGSVIPGTPAPVRPTRSSPSAS